MTNAVFGYVSTSCGAWSTSAMTPTPHPRSDRTSDHTSGIDAVPGEPEIRHTVWRTPTDGDPAPLHRHLAARLLADSPAPPSPPRGCWPTTPPPARPSSI